MSMNPYVKAIVDQAQREIAERQDFINFVLKHNRVPRGTSRGKSRERGAWSRVSAAAARNGFAAMKRAAGADVLSADSLRDVPH